MSVLTVATMASTLAFPDPALAAPFFVRFGAGPMVWTITYATLRQSVTPGHLEQLPSRKFSSTN